MVKLSLFMTDPVKAHERYQKEMSDYRERIRLEYDAKITDLEEQLEKAQKEVAGARKGVKKISEKSRQMKCQLKAIAKKNTEGKQNDI